MADTNGKSEPRPSAALRCWIEGRRIWLELDDQRLVSFPATRYPLLAAASPAELAKVQLRLNGLALRWDGLDEDIWVDDAVQGRFPRSSNAAV
jgi:hypothetical protein